MEAKRDTLDCNQVHCWRLRWFLLCLGLKCSLLEPPNDYLWSRYSLLPPPHLPCSPAQCWRRDVLLQLPASGGAVAVFHIWQRGNIFCPGRRVISEWRKSSCQPNSLLICLSLSCCLVQSPPNTVVVLLFLFFLKSYCFPIFCFFSPPKHKLPNLHTSELLEKNWYSHTIQESTRHSVHDCFSKCIKCPPQQIKRKRLKTGSSVTWPRQQEMATKSDAKIRKT